MAEFKKLSEVDLIETSTDNTTVLVEDGGEIKRVPKSQIGGGVGGYVVRLSDANIDDVGCYYIESDYDEIYDILSSGGSVWIDYTDAPEMASPSSVMTMSSHNAFNATNYGPNNTKVMLWYLTDIGLMLVDLFSVLRETPATVYFPNGSHNLEPVEQLPPS